MLHWRDHIPSNLKSFHEDYYGLKPIRIHRELGSDVLFKLLLTGRPCIVPTLSSHRINKRWTFISPLHGTQYFTKCLPVIILYRAQLNAIIVNRKYTLLGRLVNFK
jgi:hypothetical protein